MTFPFHYFLDHGSELIGCNLGRGQSIIRRKVAKFACISIPPAVNIFIYCHSTSVIISDGNGSKRLVG
jgi:hypothetical protein